MPHYDFKCPKCGLIKEVFKPMSDVWLHEICEECGTQMERQIGAGAAIIFKGDGWPGQDIKRGKK